MSLADMQVNLKWDSMGKGLSHYNIYRDTRPECESTMLNFIGQSAAPQSRMSLAQISGDGSGVASRLKRNITTGWLP